MFDVERAPIHKIIPFSCVDGPGNRSAIFFQGCDFRCCYCHNPETQNLCCSCGTCISLCPAGALTINAGKVIWNKDKCCSCDVCVQNCPTYSSPKVCYMTIEGVMTQLKPMFPFISGVTASGGECTLHHAFLEKLFEKVRYHQKTTFLDSNGQLDMKSLPNLLAVTDQVMLDIKSTNEEEHWKLTGSSNKIVLANAGYLAETGKLYEIRTVIVPDILDNRRTVRDVSRLLADYPQIRYKLIKYRPWGVRLPLKTVSPSEAYMLELEALARAEGAGQVVIT